MKTISKYLTLVAVAISAYHYTVALAAHDYFIFAACIAIFVDTLHYLTVQKAIKENAVMWTLAAVFTSALAYTLQLSFYTNAFVDWSISALIYASIVPAGIAIYSWMEYSDNASKLERTYMKRVESLVNQLEAAVNDREAAVKRLEASMNENEALMKSFDAERRGLNKRLTNREETIKELKAAKREHESMLRGVNDVAIDLMRGELTGKEIAAKHSVSAGFVSGVKKSLNGVQR